MRPSRNTTFLSFAALVAFLAAPSIAYGGGLKFEADLSDAQEVPEATTGGRGEINAKFDKAFSEGNVDLAVDTFGVVVAAHFHCGRAGENGPVLVTLVGTGGVLTFDGEEGEGTLTNADIGVFTCGGRPVNNVASLALAMRAGLIYANVHTTDVGSGEVRGQLLEK